MYSEQDHIGINRLILKNRLIWLPVLAALTGLFAFALNRRVEPLAYVAGIGLTATAIFAFTWYQLPCLRYRNFLRELDAGLSREMAGRVVSIAEAAELQDGARVLPVHLFLEDAQDERIVYLNASKRDRFPKPGANVRLKLCGRHIREVLN